MLEIADYRKIDAFKNDIQRNMFSDKDYESFRRMVSIQLGNAFKYNHVIFGYLNFTKTRELGLAITTHNLSHRFVQSFFASSILHEKSFFYSDIVVFSDKPNYSKRLIYKELLLGNGFSDFMIFFLSASGAYIGFIIVFKESAQGKFSAKDVEIILQLKEYLACAYQNYIQYLNVKGMNALLLAQNDNYPIGIVIMNGISSFSYANSTAQEYMAELEISHPKYFGMFYSNYILPDVKYGLNKLHITRYKNFIFKMVKANAVPDLSAMDSEIAQNLNFTMSGLSRETQSFIYIIKDDLSSYSKNKESYTDFLFSKKEEAIVELIILGKNNRQIAEEANISINTVRVHMQNIYKKAGVNNRTQLLFKLNNRL